MYIDIHIRQTQTLHLSPTLVVSIVNAQQSTVLTNEQHYMKNKLRENYENHTNCTFKSFCMYI